MRYYAIRIKYLADGTEKIGQTMSYGSKNSAIAKFHAMLAEDMTMEDVKGGLVLVFNSAGYIEAKESWIAEVTPEEDNSTQEG